jgi:DNA-binding beta-propeller fold protein YncE
MSPIVDERPVSPGRATEEGLGARQRRRYRRVLLPALALTVIACAVGLATRVGDLLPAVSSPAARQASVTDGGTGVVHVSSSTDHASRGPSLAEVNGIADGLGNLWLTGGDAHQNHILYGVDPATGRIDVSAELPSHLVLNPDDLAIGSGALWAAVGASVYRLEPTGILTDGAVSRAFATLPQGDLIGDIAVDAGAVWVTDTARGRVYRFAASTGRLEAVIDIGTTAGAMAVGDGGLWVADDDAHTVSRISVTHNRVDVVRALPGVPSDVAAGDGGLWVTDGTDGVVTFLRGTSGRALNIRVGGEPTGVAATGGTVWVANTADGTLNRIDARRHVVVATVPVGVRPYAVAADRLGAWVAVLGQPPMMPAPSRSSSSPTTVGPLAWLLRLCG